MADGIGFGAKRLIEKIVETHWGIKDPSLKKFTFSELLFIMQEYQNEEGKAYQEQTNMNKGHYVFKEFVKLVLYRGLANYDSMILMTSEKGCLTDDTLISTEKNLKGIPIKKLIGKGPIKVYSYNIKTKKIELKQSDGVEFAKKEKVCIIETYKGKKITGTYDHPILTIKGTYKKMCDFNPHYRERIITNDGIDEVIGIHCTNEERNTYDVVNVRDNHNFIANGFVVGNTGKSSASIMLAREYCKLIGIRFNPERHIAYTNADVMNKISILQHFEPLIADESVNFCTAADWAKKENKDLKKKLAVIRTSHLFFILCFPMKVQKIESSYLDSFVNYWCDLFGRGIGAIYVKDRNPAHDAWRIKDFQKLGSYTEFSTLSTVEKVLKKHPNFWQIIRFPKPPDWLYKRYLKVREKNVYDDQNVLTSVSKEDIHRALLIMALRDIMMHDTTLSMNRIILHIKNEYDINVTKGMVEAAVDDAKQLVAKVREKALEV